MPSVSEALAFRDDRLSKMDSLELPVTLFDAPRIILHLVPESAFEAGTHAGLPALAESAPRSGTFGEELEAFFNFEGFVQHVAGEDETSLSYVQIFRNGAVEIVHTNLLTSDREESVVDTARFERALIGAARQWLELQNQLGARAPVFLMLSLQRVRGLSLDSDERADRQAKGHAIDRDELIVPEAVLKSFEDDVARALKPLFDAVWNAAGYPRSKNFSRDGDWIAG